MEKEQGQGRVKRKETNPVQGPFIELTTAYRNRGVTLSGLSEEARAMSHLRVDVVDIFLLALIS